MRARRAVPSGASTPPAREDRHDNNGTSIATQPISFTGIVDAILEVGRQRNSLLSQMQTALQSGQNERVIEIARQLCGLSHEESHRTNTRIH